MYEQTVRVGIFKACLRYIEDPNRNLFTRIFLAISPLLAVWILSPLDLMPEIILGPLGLTDDVLILIGMALLIRLANSFYKEKRYVRPSLPNNTH
jgi:uncharacterized membrane protein YkvA (DUF1232 family)